MSRRAVAILIAGLGAGWAVIACSPDVPVPGDELLGSFRMEARTVDAGCQGVLDPQALPPDGAFSFEATLSRQKEGGEAFLTLNRISRDGGFDGQVFSSSWSATRQFAWVGDGGCAETSFTVEERLHLVLLSASQEQAIGGGCPEDTTALFEPGAVPVDPDGGVTAPAARPEGFDAQRVCGILVDVLVPAETCGMPGCTMVYRVEGVKNQ